MSGVCKNLENFEYFDNLFCPFGDFLKLNFFEYFIRESVPFFLTALMFIALILFIIYYQSKIRSLSKELTLTLNFLQKKINGKNNFEKRKLFYENYNDINDYFNETNFLYLEFELEEMV